MSDVTTLEILLGIDSMLLVPIYFQLRNINATLKSHDSLHLQHAKDIGVLEGKTNGN